jgi:DNA-binding response OmpR family regulator
MAKHILIVEDDETLCEELQDILEDEGFDVTSSHDGLDGLDLATRKDFDLLLLDLRLPGMSGLDILKEVRAKRLPIKIVVLTGSPRTDDPPKGTRPSEADDLKVLSRADRVIFKPFHIVDLLDEINRLTA